MNNRKSICDKCKNSKKCSAMDRTMNMACKDYKKKGENDVQINN